MSIQWNEWLQALESGEWSSELLTGLDSSLPSVQIIELAQTHQPPARSHTPLFQLIPKSWFVPGRDSWFQLLEISEGLGEEPQAFYTLVANLLDRNWSPWARQVGGPLATAFFDADSEDPRLQWACSLDAEELDTFEPDAFAATPHARHLTHLRVAIDFVEDTWRTLATNPSLSNLLQLSVTGGEEGAYLFPLQANLSSLEWLDLCSAEIDDDKLTQLCEAEHLRNLRHLDLGMNPDWNPNQVENAGLLALAESNVIQNLEYLDLSSNEDIGAEGIEALVNSPNAQHLKTLHLSWLYSFSDEAVEAIVHSDYLKNLEILTFQVTSHVNQVTLDALADTDNLPSLQILDLNSIMYKGQPNYFPEDTNDITPEAMEVFVQQMAERGVEVRYQLQQ